MSSSQIIQFDVLNLQAVLAECRRLNLDDYRSVAVAFNLWQRDFARRATLFYRAQYMQHYNAVWEHFRRVHHLAPGDALPEWLEREWQGWMDSEGVCDHARLVEAQCVTLEQYKIPLFSDHFGNASGLLHNLPFSFDELWFNTTIHTSPEQQAALRSLTYEVYLTTRHWQRVRAAMLLICQGMCQGEGCKAAGESWYGDETLIQVHHLCYDHVGCERFSDLRLLCDDCHHALHDARL